MCSLALYYSLAKLKPFIYARPLEGISSPVNILKVVVLPAPFTPNKPNTFLFYKYFSHLYS